MRERPIILNADSVNLFIYNGKTQYRTVVNEHFYTDNLNAIRFYQDRVVDGMGRYFRYPHGPIGDRVWVREPFRSLGVQYKSDGEEHRHVYTNDSIAWLNPVQMTKHESRLLMKQEDIRIERLQDISDSDCAAEGFDLFTFPEWWNKKQSDTTRYWSTNPLVFVSTFRVIACRVSSRGGWDETR